jgi:solute:Na+ symporter, SSS family
MLNWIDYAIIIAYFVIVVSLGLGVARRASGSIDNYFLAGKSLPWWLLGISGMATYIDISGTMLQASFYYMLGVKGYWVAYRGAVPLLLAFLMIFMGKWLRRSGAMTNAELLSLRFGGGVQGHTARILAAGTILVTVIAITAFFFVGGGKFLVLYFPFLTANQCSIILFLVTMIYCVTSGFYGLVITDLFQGILIIAVMAFITYKAMVVGTPEYMAKYTTPEWRSLAFTSWQMNMPAGYESMKNLGLLTIAWTMMAFTIGFAVPHDAWTSQKYYAAKDERDAGLTAAWWIVVFSLRFMLFMGIGILAVGITGKIGSDPEMALPAVINHYVPMGMKGVWIAALLAAGTSTLNALINSSGAYFVKDIYKAYMVPNASGKNLMVVSYITTAAIMLLGMFVGWLIPTVTAIWGWIAMALFTGLIPANILKWFWWRFNGVGFACGLASGVISAIIQGLMWPNASEYAMFFVIIAISAIGAILGTFLGKPTDMDVLVKFYRQIRPCGLWGPVRKLCTPEFVAEVKTETRRDMWLLVPSCIWQCILYWMLCALVIKQWTSFTISAVIVGILTLILYKYWYKNLYRGIKSPD